MPVQAVRYEESDERDQPAQASLFVVEDGRARQKDVDTGIADDTFIAITKGVETGARIVVGPARVLRFLHDGDYVTEAAESADTEQTGTADAAAKP